MAKTLRSCLIASAVAGIGAGLLLVSFGTPAILAGVVLPAFAIVRRVPAAAALVAAAGATGALMLTLLWATCSTTPGRQCMDVGLAGFIGASVLLALGGLAVTVLTVRVAHLTVDRSFLARCCQLAGSEGAQSEAFEEGWARRNGCCTPRCPESEATNEAVVEGPLPARR